MTGLIVHSQSPLNAEPPLDRLRAGFVTPASDFYIRCHGNIPILEEQTHRLVVVGDREAENGTAAVRLRGGRDLGAQPVSAILDRLRTEITTRRDLPPGPS